MNAGTDKEDKGPYRGVDFSLNNPAWDYPPATVEGVQYLILSGPRTGSTMLSSALIATKAAGVPDEYFNDKILDGFGTPPALDRVSAQLAEARKRRTSPNGVFGMKLHAHQFKRIFARPEIAPEAIRFLRTFSRFVIVSRQDKVAQAMSFVQSQRTGVWNSVRDGDRGSSQYEFSEADAPEICRLIWRFKDDEVFWKTVCTKLKLSVLEIRYEDLASRPVEVVQDTCRFLGIPYSGEAPLTKRLSVDSYGPQKKRFLESIGAA